MKIIIHTGSFDILRRKTGTEIMKEDFFVTEETDDCQSQHVFITGPIPNLEKGIKSFSQWWNKYSDPLLK